jgi:hypothetical protein
MVCQLFSFPVLYYIYRILNCLTPKHLKILPNCFQCRKCNSSLPIVCERITWKCFERNSLEKRTICQFFKRVSCRSERYMFCQQQEERDKIRKRLAHTLLQLRFKKIQNSWPIISNPDLSNHDMLSPL